MNISASITNPITGTGPALYLRAKRRIPGGTQLLSKRPEMFLPDNWPAYYSRAQGCTIWDLDQRAYLDFTSSGIGSCLLGYADPVVNAAVTARVAAGTMCTLNAPEEVELADTLCEIHPWADGVRFARTGGEAMAVAVRIGRAATGRDVVAVCGYHGWSDWYLAANLGESTALDGHLLPGLSPRGVPRGLVGTALTFRYNQIADLRAICAQHGERLAAIVMEPMRYDAPANGFLHEVRQLATDVGAVLVFDEITAGWRSRFGGLHLTLGVNPDVAVFAKSLSNGYPMAAIIGRGSVMESAQLSFISSTYWTEALGPAAAIATVKRLREVDVVPHIQRVGKAVQQAWRDAAARHGLTVRVGGIPALANFSFNHGEESRALMTLFTQEMLQAGFLAAGTFYPTYAHGDAEVARYADAVDATFARIRNSLTQGSLRRDLHGPVAHSGFARLT